MSIYKDAENGVLVGSVLEAHIKDRPSILDERSPDTGMTVLAISAIRGFPQQVEQLLKKGARADVLSTDGTNSTLLAANGATPLLLAAWLGEKERTRTIQLLLAKTPPGSINSTCEAAKFDTPLMCAIKKKDYESIRLLVQAGAAKDETLKNSDGYTVEQLRRISNDRLVVRALLPDEKVQAAMLAGTVTNLLLYIVAWANKAVNGLVTELFEIDPEMNNSIDQQITGNRNMYKEEFVDKIDEWVERNGSLKRFFQENDGFIQDIAEKLVNLGRDPINKLRNQDPKKMINLSLYKQVIYCDDSTTMKRHGRWESQKALVERIAKITTPVLPRGDGVALRFINRNIDNSDNLSLQGLGDLLKDMDWRPGGDTPIGTNLRSKILQPMVYNKIKAGTLKRPLLIIIMTDGMPEREDRTELERAILECEKEINDNGYPPETVKFMIGQIGTASSATKFLASLRENKDIARTALVTSEKLDDAFKDLKENDWKLDKWLIETLFSPFKNLTGKESL